MWWTLRLRWAYLVSNTPSVSTPIVAGEISAVRNSTGKGQLKAPYEDSSWILSLDVFYLHPFTVTNYKHEHSSFQWVVWVFPVNYWNWGRSEDLRTLHSAWEVGAVLWKCAYPYFDWPLDMIGVGPRRMGTLGEVSFRQGKPKRAWWLGVFCSRAHKLKNETLHFWRRLWQTHHSICPRGKGFSHQI